MPKFKRKTAVKDGRTDGIDPFRIIALSGTIIEPQVYVGLRGTPEKPIVIEGSVSQAPKFIKPLEAPSVDAARMGGEPDQKKDRELFLTTISSGDTAEEFRLKANALARRREAGGHYPTIAEVADQAMIKLIDCQHVIIRNLYFKDCWPTAIYVDNCQFITMDTLRFDGCTYGIGANGRNTHDLLVQNCRYTQSEKMWDSISWNSIHGSPNNKGEVNVADDNRHFDGDFFRAWAIFGNVTIRNNWIGNCFNGIHLFGPASGRHFSSMYHKTDDDSVFDPGGIGTELDTLAAVNVLIENNVFYKVLDNCVEPEDFAWNWVVRHNRFDSSYIPFSFGQKQGGWFYIYGNVGDLTASPSSLVDELLRKFPRLMKLPSKQNAGGPIYMFHNSWRLKKKHFGKRILRGLRHTNNLVWFKKSLDKKAPPSITMGGLFGAAQKETFGDTRPDEYTNFTRRWGDLGISFSADVTNDAFVLNKSPQGLTKEQKKYLAARNYWALNYGFVEGAGSPVYNKGVFKARGFDPLTAVKKLKPLLHEVDLPRRFGGGRCPSLLLEGASTIGALQGTKLAFVPTMKMFSETGDFLEEVDDFPFLPDIEPQVKALEQLEKSTLVIS